MRQERGARPFASRCSVVLVKVGFSLLSLPLLSSPLTPTARTPHQHPHQQQQPTMEDRARPEMTPAEIRKWVAWEQETLWWSVSTNGSHPFAAPQGSRPAPDGLDFHPKVPPVEREGIRRFVERLSERSIVRRFGEGRIAPFWTQAWVTKGWHGSVRSEHFTVLLFWRGHDG
ncbi:uncharacterized protein EI97DRAFT_470068 [Westerdykella ornata]|uniref:Uncharacterized protein n=1 Tax=Westerdykella ornata TaxID=318751 RepID=A0A6A6J8Q0_WESOR|nr:uncharacterized protein EI97DRAFT_470068 [Westerdykella ornata]KAF2272802.1 hypothetical protein EI97DRAFT_470068 [Westerdykella ornata]